MLNRSERKRITGRFFSAACQNGTRFCFSEREFRAVDHAHRIGQTKHIFAYRLIARDSVEEKVLELQITKRDLAAAIIGEDNSLIRDLRREDLELLLS